MNVNEGKAGLAPYKNRRIRITGLYGQSDRWTDHANHREYRTVCLVKPEDEHGNLLADHVWIHHADPIMGLKPAYPERITLTGLVSEYNDNSKKTP